ncbi:MAG: DnaJ domain-containing protein [Muribaculaceae bacterium]|nr:DnaJ domain-containing protein [Muribaculaceae bacterium]
MNRLEELTKYFNISPNCSEVEMYRAYRELRIQYHPDKPNGDIDKYNEVCRNFEELVNLRSNSCA